MNRERLERVAREIERMQDDLHFADLYATFKSKLLDQIARGQMDDLTMQEYQRMVRRFFRPEYWQYLSNVFSDYVTLVDIINAEYNDMGWELNRSMDKVVSMERILNSRFGNYEDASVRFISKTIKEGIRDGLNHVEIGEKMSKSADRKVNFYADTLSRTAVKGYNRGLVKIKAEIADVRWFQYVGILRPGTRPFCCACLNQYFKSGEVRLMLNGHVSPVSQYAGGWNCHHDLEPDPDYTDADGDDRGFSAIEKREGGKIVRFFGTSEMSRAYDERKKMLKGKS